MDRKKNFPARVNTTQKSYKILPFLALILLLSGSISEILAQAEVMAWGNITGIRIDGQFIEFESSLCAANPDWTVVSRTAKEKQRPAYAHKGNKHFITTNIDSLFFTETIEDTGKAEVKVVIETEVHPHVKASMEKLYLRRHQPDLHHYLA